MVTDNEATAKTFKAFSDERRLFILDVLNDGEHCACEVLDKMEISQSTLSHHMKILCDAGIVTGRKSGKWMHYRILPQGISHAQELLKIYLLNDDESK